MNTLTDLESLCLAALRGARDFIQTVNDDTEQRRILGRINETIVRLERRVDPDDDGVEYDEDSDGDITAD